MRTRIAKITLSNSSDAELHHGSAELEVPRGTSWDSIAAFGYALTAAYAKLWNIRAANVTATVTLMDVERKLVRCDDLPK